MKVVSKQRNSRMCAICGLDNEYGVKAPFYNMEDKSVMTKFEYKKQHQSFPERVHGGLVAAMLDEMGLRALWAEEGNENTYGVTMDLNIKYRKPVPYEEIIVGKGKVVKNSSKFLVTEAELLDNLGNVLANGVIKYLKLKPEIICDDNISIHEEMCYLIEDDVKEIN